MTSRRGLPADRDPLMVVVLMGAFGVGLMGRTELPAALGGENARFGAAALLGFVVLMWTGALAATKTRQRLGPVPKVVMAFLAIHMLSGLWSRDGARLGVGVANDLVMILLAYATAVAAAQNPTRSRRHFLVLMCLAGLVFCAGSAISGSTSGIGRSIAFGGGPNVFARIVIWGAIAGVTLAYVRRSKIWLAVVPVMALFAVLSGSRGALVAALGTGLVMAVVLRRQLTTRQFNVIVVMAPAVAWIIWNNSQVRYIAERRFSVQDLTESGFSGRQGLWGASADLFREHALVGNGMDSFQAAKSFTTGFPYPHNLVLEVANDLGLVGLSILGSLLFVVLNELFRARRAMDAARWGIVAAAIFTFGCTMFSGDIYDSRFVWMFLCLAFPVRSSFSTTSKPANRQLEVRT